MKQGEYKLPKFRKGTEVRVRATGFESTVEAMHLDGRIGHFYSLKGIMGAYLENELEATKK